MSTYSPQATYYKDTSLSPKRESSGVVRNPLRGKWSKIIKITWQSSIEMLVFSHRWKVHGSKCICWMGQEDGLKKISKRKLWGRILPLSFNKKNSDQGFWSANFSISQQNKRSIPRQLEQKIKKIYDPWGIMLTYFGHTSSMEARIFMKFETYLHKIVLDPQPNFQKDPCKDARARGKNTRTCDALQRFRSESTKIKKMRFRPFLNRHQ